VNAEPRIVETLLSVLEEVAEKPRRPLVDEPTPYARAVWDAKPLASWRLEEMSIPTARDAMGKHDAAFEKGVALFLMGMGRVGAPPAVPGVSPGTSSVERPPPRDMPNANERNPTLEGPGRMPGPAGGTPTLPNNGDAPRKIMRLDKLSTVELVAALDSPNEWQRDKAHTLLAWRADKSAVPLLEEIAAECANPLSRLHALCLTETPTAVLHALGDKHPGVRENALRIAGKHATPEIIAAAVLSSAVPHARTLSENIAKAGGEPRRVFGPSLTKLALAYGDKPFAFKTLADSFPALFQSHDRHPAQLRRRQARPHPAHSAGEDEAGKGRPRCHPRHLPLREDRLRLD